MEKFQPDEKLIAELRQRQLTPKGRAKLRERVTVKYSLSYLGRWQGNIAPYPSMRKNLFDLCHTAIIHNIHVLVRLFKDDSEQLGSKAGIG